jgi:hypothetical protein
VERKIISPRGSILAEIRYVGKQEETALVYEAWEAQVFPPPVLKIGEYLLMLLLEN